MERYVIRFAEYVNCEISSDHFCTCNRDGRLLVSCLRRASDILRDALLYVGVRNGPQYPFVVQVYEVYATLIHYLLISSRSLGNSGRHT